MHYYRCSRCRTRNRFRRRLETYVRAKRCRDCGHQGFYLDRERTYRVHCDCNGYHHPHRPGSRCCEKNPLADLHRAKRAGVNFAEETFFDFAGEVSVECPF